MCTPRRYLAVVLLALQLAWLCAVGSAAAAVPADIVLEKGTTSVRIERGVELLTEVPGENLTPEQAMSAQLANRWSPYAGKRINLERQATPVWIRFNVRHEAERDTEWVLGISWPLLQEVDFHQFDPGRNQWVASYRAGVNRPPNPKLLRDPGLLFPMAMQPGERASVLLRVKTDSQLLVPLVLWEKKELHASRYDRAVMLGLLFGILGVMLFYNLSLFIFTRDRTFLSYSVYLLSIVLYELAVTGYGSYYVWGGTDWLKSRAYELFASCSFLAASVFFRHFLDLKNAARHLNWISLSVINFWVVATVMALFPATRLLIWMIGIGGIVGSLAGVYSSVYLVAQGNVLARYFALAWITIIVATIVMMLSMFGVIDAGWWLQYVQQIGFVVETLLLSVALAERIKRETASKEAAQRESLRLTGRLQEERDEKIRAQEHALAVQLHANEELELRVLDRTAELKRAMQNIELANVELAKLSVTDALTKVHNRRYFDDTLKKEHDRSARTGAPLALLLADIDHFKRINDSVGHLAGDECLKLVAATLAATVGRSTDLVARYGGEEFAIVLPGTDAEHALAVAERVRKAVEDIQFIYRGKRVPVSISVGVVARVAAPDRPVADFLLEADEALYAAKGAGRNQVQLAANG
ncbi:MAG: diguanylate cyclase [Cytophagales bacterium]|nr:diguanylate cyclase [Rhizobacter sp.]